MNVFTCDAKKFKYTRTRRGVNAVCPIQRDGAVVATLHDVAEHIVAKVEFVNSDVRTEFLAEARANGYKQTSDDHAISEYARQISMDAEEV